MFTPLCKLRFTRNKFPDIGRAENARNRAGSGSFSPLLSIPGSFRRMFFSELSDIVPHLGTHGESRLPTDAGAEAGEGPDLRDNGSPQTQTRTSQDPERTRIRKSRWVRVLRTLVGHSCRCRTTRQGDRVHGSRERRHHGEDSAEMAVLW